MASTSGSAAPDRLHRDLQPRARPLGIFHAQPIVLNERQAGAAIEGVVRQERIETSQLAVDTHGYTDFAMGLARLLGFDLGPRLRELRQRHLIVPRGMKVVRFSQSDHTGAADVLREAVALRPKGLWLAQ